MDFDLEDFLMSENRHLFTDNHESINKPKSWLINFETKESKLIIDDIPDGVIPEVLKTYDWLTELEIDSQNIIKLENLPQNLKTLSLFNNLIEIIPANELPNKLESLNLARNKLKMVQNIPDTVKVLDVSYNLIRDCYLLTNTNLEKLSIESNFIEEIPLLLDGIKKLDISQNKLKYINNLANSIEDLDISVNEITLINSLPKNLKRLVAFSNKIEKFDEVPETLEYIDLSFNKLSVLPKLSNNIYKADLTSNNINELGSEDNISILRERCRVILNDNPLEKFTEIILQDKRFIHNKVKTSELLDKRINRYIEIKLKKSITL